MPIGTNLLTLSILNIKQGDRKVLFDHTDPPPSELGVEVCQKTISYVCIYVKRNKCGWIIQTQDNHNLHVDNWEFIVYVQ